MPSEREYIVYEVGDDARLARWVRASLVVIAVLLATVMTTAAWLHPYDANGQALRQETHRQLGLPPCSFYKMTGIPCPSCGFTTSFALLMHVDPLNALQANSAGAVLAGFCLVVIPWGIISAFRARYLFIESAERVLIHCLICFVTLMLVRWAIIAALAWGS
jgi:hypothetical protein